MTPDHMPENPQTMAEESSSGNPAFSPLSILRTIWKRKIRIGVVWLLLTACTLVVVRSLPTVYLAEAHILIDTQKIPEKYVSSTVASDVEDRLSAIRQTLLARDNLKKIIDDFDLYARERKTKFEEDILELMRKDISITLEPVGSGMATTEGSRLLTQATQAVAFRIGYESPDPQLAARVANRLTDLYVDQNIRTREGEAAGTSQFLESQLGEAKKTLDDLEARMSAYKLQHNGELPQQEQALGNTLARLQTELEANRDAINRVQQTKVILEGNRSAMETTLAAQLQAWRQTQQAAAASGSVLLPDQQGKAPQKKTSEAMQEQLTVLLGRYSANHPDVVRLKEDIEKVKKIEQEAEAKTVVGTEDAKAAPGGRSGNQTAAAPAREPVEFARTREQIAGLQAQIKASDAELENRTAEQKRILANLDSYQKHVERLPVREQEMAGLTRDYKMSQENYQSLLDKKMAADMALDMEQRQQAERFEILDHAQVPQKPIKPKRPQLYAGGTAASLALAIALGFLAELKRNVMLGEWELPKDTPVLARLPHIEITSANEKKPAPKRPWFRRKKPLAENVVAALVVALVARGLHWPIGLL
jgi:succinoglycan biosynthesis transport protein ExoP